MVLTSSDDGWNHSRAKLVGMVDFHYFEYIWINSKVLKLRKIIPDINQMWVLIVIAAFLITKIL